MKICQLTSCKLNNSACRQDINEIPTAIPVFPGTSIPTVLLGSSTNVTGNWLWSCTTLRTLRSGSCLQSVPIQACKWFTAEFN